MTGNGYSFVTDHGFRAFGQDLEQGPWALVSVAGYDAEDGMAQTPLDEAPMIVGWKLRVLWGIRSLAAAVGPDVLVEHDVEWDSAQRAFNLGVATAEEHKNPAVRAAAGRVRKALLQGAGTAQTTLGFEQEVDFGRDQVKLAAASPLAEDVATIGAGHHLQRIDEATEAFAKAMGREKNKGRAPSRTRRIRDAVAVCTAAFNSVHDGLGWAIEHTSDLQERARLESLLAPFHALLDRYSSAAAAKATDEGATEEEEAPTEPAPKADATTKPADVATKPADATAKPADPAAKPTPKPA